LRSISSPAVAARRRWRAGGGGGGVGRLDLGQDVAEDLLGGELAAVVTRGGAPLARRRQAAPHQEPQLLIGEGLGEDLVGVELGRLDAAGETLGDERHGAGAAAPARERPEHGLGVAELAAHQDQLRRLRGGRLQRRVPAADYPHLPALGGQRVPDALDVAAFRLDDQNQRHGDSPATGLFLRILTPRDPLVIPDRPTK
jgi:hypothetical protein